MILFSLSKMGFSIEDSKQIPFSVFNEITELQIELVDSPKNNKQQTRKATQSDMDTFF